MSGALILAPFAAERLEELRGAALAVTHESWLETGELHDPEDLGRRLAAEQITHVVIEADFVFEETMDLAPSLRFVGICRNALNHVDVEAATERGVLVVNTPGRNGIAVAELTVALMLSVSRRVPGADAWVHGRNWLDPAAGYSEFRGSEIHGKTVGIIGLGAIGRMVAERLAGFGAMLIAADPFVNPEAASHLGVRLVSQDELLANSDYVLVHVPAGEGTYGLIGEAAFGAMKGSAFLINVSAAGVVDEAALAVALRERALGGAALDVFEGHPLPDSSPLLDLDNVILTPHIGGATHETVERQSAMITEDILRIEAGERPERLVNPEAWARRRA